MILTLLTGRLEPIRHSTCSFFWRTSMIKIILTIFAAAAFWGGTANAQVLVFENVNVIPMDRERLLEKQTVIIRDGRIAQIGPSSVIQVPAGALRVEASGKYLMPGIAEMHGHLPGSGSTREFTEHILFLYVANGITTVRGMLGNPAHLALRADVAAKRILGPRLYVAGPPFSGSNATSAAVAETMVREQKAAGYDLLKLTEGIRPEVYLAIARAAREAGIDFAGHVPNAVGIRVAIAERQRSIDHLDNYLDELEGDPQAAQRKIEELARLTRQSGVWNVPTMALWENYHGDRTGDQLRAALPELRYMPRSTVEQWVRQKNSMLQTPGGMFMGFGVGSAAGARVTGLRRKLLKGLHAAGAKIAFGTDSPQTFNVPGFSLHHEMQVMVASGLTSYDVLSSATRNPAEYFGTLADTGTVEQGKRADLLLLDANPLLDVSNVAKRAGVVIHGQWLTRKEIEVRLESLAAAAAKM